MHIPDNRLLDTPWWFIRAKLEKSRYNHVWFLRCPKTRGYWKSGKADSQFLDDRPGFFRQCSSNSALRLYIESTQVASSLPICNATVFASWHGHTFKHRWHHASKFFANILSLQTAMYNIDLVYRMSNNLKLIATCTQSQLLFFISSSSLLYRNSIKFDDYIPGVRGIFVLVIKFTT